MGNDDTYDMVETREPVTASPPQFEAPEDLDFEVTELRGVPVESSRSASLPLSFVGAQAEPVAAAVGASSITDTADTGSAAGLGAGAGEGTGASSRQTSAPVWMPGGLGEVVHDQATATVEPAPVAPTHDATHAPAEETALRGSTVPDSHPRWSYTPPMTPLPAPPTAPPADDASPEVVVEAVRPGASTPLHIPTFGPAGRRRNPAVVVLLSIVTLGIYPLALHRTWNGEMSDFDPKMLVDPGRSTWAVVLPWLLGLLSSLAGAASLVVTLGHVAVPFADPIPLAGSIALAAGLLLVPYLELLLSFSAVAIVMTSERVRILEDRVGIQSDRQIRPASAICWLLVPVIGGLVLLSRTQQALNGVWSRVAPPASSRGHI